MGGHRADGENLRFSPILLQMGHGATVDFGEEGHDVVHDRIDKIIRALDRVGWVSEEIALVNDREEECFARGNGEISLDGTRAIDPGEVPNGSALAGGSGISAGKRTVVRRQGDGPLPPTCLIDGVQVV
jgi:hypothetical protein